LLVVALSISILSVQAYIELTELAAAPGPVSEDDLSFFTEQWLHLVVMTISTPAPPPQVVATRMMYALVGCFLVALFVGGCGISLLWRDLTGERSRN
jgi:hypothetical protein